jgi:hypothetical protein
MGEYQNSIGRTASDLFLATKSLKPNPAVGEKPSASRFCIVDVHERGAVRGVEMLAVLIGGIGMF